MKAPGDQSAGPVLSPGNKIFPQLFLPPSHKTPQLSPTRN